MIHGRLALKIAHPIGHEVALRSDAEARHAGATIGIVRGYLVRGPNLVSYLIGWPDRTETQHYAFELVRHPKP